MLALLLCPLCARPLSLPVTLPCAHSVCSHHLPALSVCPLSHPKHSSAVACTPPPQLDFPPEHRFDVTLTRVIPLLRRHQPHLLSHLRDQSRVQRSAPPDQPVPDPLEKELLSELTCEICFTLLYQPVTTPCQHTFCSRCLLRSLDHSPLCPLCRQHIPVAAYFQDHPCNKLILSIILEAFPKLYADRGNAIEAEERDARLDTPIFVGQLCFPGMPTLLHFFEPRYRLMLRRCLQSRSPRFGMIMPPRIGPSRSYDGDYGTMLEIRSVQILPDGRSMVETWGTHRFRVMERGSLDGYMVGRIEVVEDIPDHIIPSIPPQTNDELVTKCKAFLNQLRQGMAPWVVERLHDSYGPMPDDPVHFSFWVTLVLPIDEHEKAKLLPLKSVRLRLLLVVHWIEQLSDNWWFLTGCVIL